MSGDDPIGPAEIALVVGVTRATVYNWRCGTAPGFPPPSWPIEQTGRPMWRRADILEWAYLTGRLQRRDVTHNLG